ncbi:hypothetical protein BDV96DRAFT_465107, partial [Lophiotrema nucula]
IVTLEIGTEKTKYYVHKDYLMHHSPYFRKALSGPWIEAEERLVTLEDVEVQPFNVFVHWLYTQAIPTTTDEWVKVSEAKKWKIEMLPSLEKAFSDDQQVLQLLTFGDRFATPAFERDINNTIVDSLCYRDGSTEDWSPPYILVIYAFQNLPANHPFLSLMVDLQCKNWDKSLDDEEDFELMQLLPHEFLTRVMIRYGDLKCGAGKEALDPCDYHIHLSDGERRDRRKQ